MGETSWLDPGELRIGLGCMRLSTDAAADDDRALATIAAAADAGITVFDTARAYDDNERLLARALRAVPGARVVTKGGMARHDGAWIPDGRARTVRADCEASLEALDGLPIDLYLLHTPDPGTPWRTSIRALGRLVEDGLVTRIGVCNVNRGQLDEAARLAPIACVQVALSVLDDTALRGGILDRCDELGIALVAHSPLGGPRRVGRLAKDERLVGLAAEHDASPAEIALAWLLALSPNLVAIPGARRPETARSAARAAGVRLREGDRERLRRTPARRRRPVREGDVVIVMGVPGAGKSRLAADLAASGYVRLNRDERGGSLREVADTLDAALASGDTRVVLDNTYLTRASRSHVVEAAGRHGVPVRCVWLDTPLAQAQINLVWRLLGHFGHLPEPAELAAATRSEPGILTPTRQMRAFRELEEPGEDEGFATIHRVPFERTEHAGSTGVFVAAAAVGSIPPDLDSDAPHLVFDWRPDGELTELDAVGARFAGVVAGTVERAACTHPGGPPTCWCRPPLPGLVLAFARRHDIDPGRSVLVGTSAAHRTLANALGATFLSVS